MRCNRFLTVFLTAVLLLPAGVPVAYAQDKPDAEVTEEQAGEDSAAETNEAEDDSQSDDGNFIPTEKINVDSSVSFPVDI